MAENIFEGAEIIDLCESIMESHRAIKTISMIFSESDYENDNGNAFQGKIHKVWFRKVIDEMLKAQVDKLDQIVEIYKKEQKRLEDD